MSYMEPNCLFFFSSAFDCVCCVAAVPLLIFLLSSPHLIEKRIVSLLFVGTPHTQVFVQYIKYIFRQYAMLTDVYININTQIIEYTKK